jgi:hypothetical protein
MLQTFAPFAIRQFCCGDQLPSGLTDGGVFEHLGIGFSDGNLTYWRGKPKYWVKRSPEWRFGMDSAYFTQQIRLDALLQRGAIVLWWRVRSPWVSCVA